MNDQCGLVNESNPCRCARTTQGFIDKGYLDPHRMQFTAQRSTRVREVAPSRLGELQDLAERQHAEVFHGQAFLPAPDQVAVLRRILDSKEFRHALADEL